MSEPLKSYRVYCYDGSSLDLLSVDTIEAAGDTEAIALAEAAGFGDKCEIWDGERLVAQLSGQRRTG